jgi:hypothetical protein
MNPASDELKSQQLKKKLENERQTSAVLKEENDKLSEAYTEI